MLQVHNYLYYSGEADYDAALVEQVAEHTERNPIVAGYDPTSYWAPLAQARRSAATDRA